MRKATDYRPEILKQAARLFAHKPFHEVLMDDVADKAGVAKGTLYRFYPNKEELYAAICFDWIDELTQEMRQIAGREVDVRTRLEAIMIHAIDQFRKYQDFFRVLQRQETQQALYHNRDLLARRAGVRDIYARLIREGQAQGLFRGGDATRAADMLMGMLRSLLWFGDPKQSSRAITRGVIELFFHGVVKNGKGARASCK